MIYFLKRKFFCLLVATGLFTFSLQSSAVIVLVETPLGNFYIELFDDEAPATVDNFLSYIGDNSYSDSFIHRSASGFVIQGGAYTYIEGVLGEVVKKSPVPNEFNRSNTRGTIAMAKQSNDPNSATSSWFINIADNADLDTQNGGFTVFGQVIDNGMDVVDAIHNLETYNAGGDFSALPLINYPGTGNIEIENIVFTKFSIPPELNAVSDLQLTKSVNIQSPTIGSSVEFLVTVTNAGPDPATNIEAMDLLPIGMAIPDGMAPATSQGAYNSTTGIWQIGSLPVGNNATLSLPAVPLQYSSPECFVNKVAITDLVEYDSSRANNSAIAPVYVGGVSNCAQLTVTVTPEVYFETVCTSLARDYLDFYISIYNDGPDAAQNVSFELTGDLGNIAQITTDELSFTEVAPGKTARGILSWPLNCLRATTDSTYTVAATTDTTISTNSVITVSGVFNVPAQSPATVISQGEDPLVSDGGCFIATAAYGSYMHPHVSTLRTFRDTVLMKTYLGREFVSYYYEYSPAIAAIIADNRFLGGTVRLLLTPIVYAIAYPLLAMFIFISFGLILIINRKVSLNK